MKLASKRNYAKGSSLDEQQKIVQKYNEKQKELKEKLEEILKELQTTKLNAYEEMGLDRHLL